MRIFPIIQADHQPRQTFYTVAAIASDIGKGISSL
jgi:hypothetical protein